MTQRPPLWLGRSDEPRPSARIVRATRPDPVSPLGASSRGQAALARTLAYGLWAAIGLALVLGLVNCAGAASPAPPPPVASAPAAEVPPTGGCAELTVAAWLAGDTALLAGVPGLAGVDPEPGRRRAEETYTVSVAAGPAPDTWVYVIGAMVSEHTPPDDPEADAADPGSWRPAGTRFFTVTMAPSDPGCGGWSPTTLPARVVGPTLAGAPASAYSLALPTSDTALSETLDAFFAALLAGAGNLERYTAPGSTVPAFGSPPPYPEVHLVDVRAHTTTPVDRSDQVPDDGTVARLLVTVGTDPDQADLPLVYPVTVTVRGGRWEVVALDPAVDTVGPDPSSTRTPRTP